MVIRPMVVDPRRNRQPQLFTQFGRKTGVACRSQALVVIGRYEFDAALGATHPRNACMKEGFVLKEIEVTTRHLFGVVGGAISSTANGGMVLSSEKRDNTGSR